MRKNCLRKLLFLNTLLFVGIFLLLPSRANAQQCTITNPATSIQTSVGEYGAARDGGARSHRGVDIMIPMCVPVPNQTIGGLPCQVMMNGTSPLWKTGGYGLYARYYCNPRVEVRYAHLNGWTNGMPSNGRSGAARPTPPHVHYEVLVYPEGSNRGGVKVDPQCVWGGHPKPANCCIGLGGGSGCNLGASPADMCDGTTLNNLMTNANNRGYGRGKTTSKTIQTGIDPSQVGPGPFEKDLPECEDTPPNQQQSVEHEHDHAGPDLEAGGELPVLQPPPYIPPPPGDLTPPPEVPGVPPPPPVPGQPGGDPKLVITLPTNENSKLNGCGTDTWTAMVNQAAIEARREDILNKRFIVKSDSVLRFGCFDKNVKVAADELGSIFTNTKNWDNRRVDIIGKTVTMNRYHEDGLKNALASIVERSMTSYLNQQFNHAPLSGSTPVSGQTGGQNCDLIDRVWKAAKCKNFDDVKVFYKFDDLKDFEPREFPANMACDG